MLFPSDRQLKIELTETPKKNSSDAKRIFSMPLSMPACLVQQECHHLALEEARMFWTQVHLGQAGPDWHLELEVTSAQAELQLVVSLLTAESRPHLRLLALTPQVQQSLRVHSREL